MYRNGAAAFLIPFFIAILVCGLPILILEINLGNKWRKSHIKIFEEFGGKKGRYFGWLQSTVVWVMASFYGILVAWTLVSLVVSFVPSWLNETDFFTNKVLQMDKTSLSGFTDLGGINWYILLAYLIVWGIVIGIVSLGVEKGIDKANKIFMPGLFIMLVCMAIYSGTLTGAGTGLQHLFEPNIAKLKEMKTWTSAFGSGFFTLSICTAAIIIFSGYAPKDQDNTNQAFIIVFGDVLVAMIAAITIFAGIGNIAVLENKNFEEVFGAGETSLVFSVFPKIFAEINNVTYGLGNFLGIIFFLTVFFAGISSLIMATEGATSPLHLDLNVKRLPATMIVGGVAMVLGFVLVFKNSALLIDGIASWVAGLWQLIIGIIEIIGVCFVWKKIQIICDYNNKNSWIKLRKLFKLTLFVVAPLVLIISIIMNFWVFVNNIISQPFIFAAVGGIVGITVVVMLAFILAFNKEIKQLFQKIWSERKKG